MRILTISFLICVFFALVGCGGSNSAAPQQSGGSDFEVYRATLPDGSPMTLEVYVNTEAVWEGEFEVDSATGPYAGQAGTFGGSIEDGKVSAQCSLSTGSTFQLSGITNGDASMTLTRSDIPGASLNFLPVHGKVDQSSAGSIRFTYTLGLVKGGGNMSGVAILNGTPVDYGSFKQYTGTWQSLSIRLNVAASGTGATIFVDFGANEVSGAKYGTLTLSNIGKGSVQADFADLEFISPAVRQYIVFIVPATIAP